MKNCLLILSLFSFGFLFSQSNDAVYINRSKIEGNFKGKVFISPTLKLKVNGKTKRFNKNKVDSIRYNNLVYRIERNFLAPRLLRQLSVKDLNIYELNGKKTVLKRQSSTLFPIPKRNYHKPLSILSNKAVPRRIGKEEFIHELNTLVITDQQLKSRLDSAISQKKQLITRLSILKPELGLEIKVTPSISFYTAFGLNSITGVYFERKLTTFIDFDQINELRFFYNQKKRVEKGKNSYNYSGFYTAPTYMQLFKFRSSPQRLLGVVQGWQDNLLFNKLFGGVKMGLLYNTQSSDLIFMGTYSFGWVF